MRFKKIACFAGLLVGLSSCHILPWTDPERAGHWLVYPHGARGGAQHATPEKARSVGKHSLSLKLDWKRQREETIKRSKKQ